MRIKSIDIVRGIAILGILLINIQLFAFPFPVKDRPTLWGDFSGINRWVWILFDLIAEKRFMNIFCILFGTSVLLFCESAAKRTQNVTLPYFRRYLGLIVIGFLHALFLWYGDILLTYGIVALFLYFVRNKSAKFYFWGFVLTFFIAFGVYELFYYWVKIGKLDLTGYFNASYEIEQFRSSYLTQLKFRWDNSAFYELNFPMNEDFWRSLSLMLLGMGLYRVKFFELDQHLKAKWRFVVFGLPIGYFLAGSELAYHFINKIFETHAILNFSPVNYWVAPLLAMSYLSIILLWVRSDQGHWLMELLSKAGRMSLTNYLATTLICTTLFYGHGFGLFGQVTRLQTAFIVLLIWTFLLFFSHFWMTHHQHGPVEKVWRKITWGRS